MTPGDMREYQSSRENRQNAKDPEKRQEMFQESLEVE